MASRLDLPVDLHFGLLILEILLDVKIIWEKN
jgi:hypothetical protein